MLKSLIKELPPVKSILWRLDNQNERDEFIKAELASVGEGKKILDAGCGSQRYRQYCSHLEYSGQDFGAYETDDKKMMGSTGVGGEDGYKYGQLDYVGDIWDIKEESTTFDVILCTEVFEHIPYPNETIKEFSRLLKPGGQLILTAPSNCLRHMDPYYFYTGFSDRWFEKMLQDHGFINCEVSPVGDYYSWLSVEMFRTAQSHSILSKVLLLPAFLYFLSKKKTTESVNTLCMGYHVLATKSQ